MTKYYNTVLLSDNMLQELEPRVEKAGHNLMEKLEESDRLIAELMIEIEDNQVLWHSLCVWSLVCVCVVTCLCVWSLVSVCGHLSLCVWSLVSLCVVTCLSVFTLDCIH